MNLPRATKRIPRFTSKAVRGGVYAVEVNPSVFCYFFVIHNSVGIYPVASVNSTLPLSLFSPKTWRWLRWPWMHFPQNSQFLGRLEITEEDVTSPKNYQYNEDRIGGLLAEFEISCADGNYIKAEPRECLELPKYIRSHDLSADMLALLPQMMVVDGNLFPEDVKSTR